MQIKLRLSEECESNSNCSQTISHVVWVIKLSEKLSVIHTCVTGRPDSEGGSLQAGPQLNMTDRWRHNAKSEKKNQIWNRFLHQNDQDWFNETSSWQHHEAFCIWCVDDATARSYKPRMRRQLGPPDCGDGDGTGGVTCSLPHSSSRDAAKVFWVFCWISVLPPLCSQFDLAAVSFWRSPHIWCHIWLRLPLSSSLWPSLLISSSSLLNVLWHCVLWRICSFNFIFLLLSVARSRHSGLWQHL